jgi:hypothetical protein
MIGRLIRAMTHARRLRAVHWDMQHAESGIVFYTAELARLTAKAAAIEAERNSIRFPLPRRLIFRGRA